MPWRAILTRLVLTIAEVWRRASASCRSRVCCRLQSGSGSVRWRNRSYCGHGGRRLDHRIFLAACLSKAITPARGVLEGFGRTSLWWDAGSGRLRRHRGLGGGAASRRCPRVPFSDWVGVYRLRLLGLEFDGRFQESGPVGEIKNRAPLSGSR
jgi:hypothetical protein